MKNSKVDLEKKIRILSQKIEQNPKESSLFIERAQLYGEMENRDEKLSDLNRAIELRPDYWPYFKKRGYFYLMEYFHYADEDLYNDHELSNKYYDLFIKDYDACIALMEKLDNKISLILERIELRSNLRRDFIGAISDLDMLMEIDGDKIQYKIEKVTQLEKLGKTEDVLGLLNEIMVDQNQTESEKLEVLELYAKNSIEAGMITVGIENYFKFIEICESDDEKIRILIRICEIYIDEDDQQNAKNCYSEILGLKDSWTPLYLERISNIQISLDYFSEAISTFELIIKHNRNYIQEFSSTQFEWFENSDSFELSDEAEDYGSCHVIIIEASITIGKLYRKMDDFSESINSLNRAIEFWEDLSEFGFFDWNYESSIYYERGITYSKALDFESALDDFNEAIGIDGNIPEYFFERANVKTFLGDFEGASSDLKLANQL
jgi:tetratricopeptide (TPR) repeat protein